MKPMVVVILAIVATTAVAAFIWLLSRSSKGERIITIITPKPRIGAFLICIGGPDKGQLFPLQSKQTAIGRMGDCDIVLNYETVSRHHALIAYQNGQFILYDQDSTNGTWVNGQRVYQYVIDPGDQIQIGPDIFVLQFADQRGPVQEEIRETFSPSISEIKRRVYDLTEYEFLEELPSGRAATVYKARSKRDGRIVAVKVLHSTDPYIKDKFYKEIEIGKVLIHPHIVQVYGGGNSNGVWYMVMEFMDGGTLRDRMKGQPLPLDFTIRVIGQMCDALAYAHRKRIYHRDVKPENILFDSKGIAKLGDFGIARLSWSATRTARGIIIGTPLYMSYEQARGISDIDHRTDIYSLGVVMYEMLAGRPPFWAEDPLKILDMHLQAIPEPPRRFNPQIPEEIEAAILRALEKDRNRRFQTVEEMARAIGYTESMHLYDAIRTELEAPAIRGLKLVRFDNVVIPLTGNITPLNRGTVNPADLEISRQHAQVVYRGGCWWLEDLGSTNGTYVNGRRIFEPVMLQPGDEIRLGSTTLVVVEA
ncbi:MAG: hypothetical protein DRI61_14965 [Chloroflexi bacterium]|nr:MAG: hypothetical protein DRI61_14965 [Chloroflexota bacterium]